MEEGHYETYQFRRDDVAYEVRYFVYPRHGFWVYNKIPGSEKRVA